MHTLVLPVDPHDPDRHAIARAADVLRRGGLVAFPTETVYGLGALALDPLAVARIYTAKGRPASNPIIVHVADADAVGQVATAWPETAARLAERFWPGPLTLVLPRHPDVPDLVTANGETVGVRVPAHPVAQALLRAVAAPVAAPSANRSCELSPTCGQHVLGSLEGRIEVLVDAGPTPGGIESTVLDLASARPRLLRPGLVSLAELEAVVGPVERAPAPAELPAILPSPGMMARHYAPRTTLECVGDSGRDRARALCEAGQRVGWVTFLEKPGLEHANLVVEVLPATVIDCSARLYAVLHRLDALQLDRIIVALPPHTEEWLAVHDRLQRASS
jgi:L-threonylcarbamoyladenylate synthase